MKKAVVLLSGGMDSTTVLAYARQQGFSCYALTINYGQRSVAELKAAKQQAQRYAEQHNVVSVDLGVWGGSALTDKTIALPTESAQEIPVTYVPARNAIFLSLATSWAEAMGAHDIFCGANQVDYSHYPDCRAPFLECFERLINLGTKKGIESGCFKVRAPLLHLSKAAIIQLGVSLAVSFQDTVSCYDAESDGRACGRCAACLLRKKGFEEAGLPDVTNYVTESASGS